MTTEQPITAPPAGYTLIDIPANMGGGKGLWVQYRHTYHRDGSVFEIIGTSDFDTMLRHWNAFKRDDDGNVVLNQEGIDATEARSAYSVLEIYIIPDIELPEDMSRHHTYFNETTRKWEKPNVLHETRAHHERNADFDVNLARWTIRRYREERRWRTFLQEREGADARAAFRTEIQRLDALADEHLDFAWRPILIGEMVESLNAVYRPESDDTLTSAAVKSIDTYLAAVAANKRLGAHHSEFHAKFQEWLLEDAAKSAQDASRHWKRGFIIVDTLSTGDDANALEVTAASIITKIKAAVAPAEGEPMPAA